jgi:Ca2+-binding RTX toxin-like protein
MAGFKKSPSLEMFSPVFPGTDGNDVLIGSIYADTFLGSRGNDSINGLGGDDILSYENMAIVKIVEVGPNPLPIIVDAAGHTGVKVDLLAGTASKTFTTYTVTSSSVISSTQVFADQLVSIEHVTGTVGKDTLLGSNGNNVLSGMGGDDVIDGRLGRDTLDGGSGEDSLFGGDGADSLSGGDNNDFLVGGAGSDRINGGDQGPDSGITVTPVLPHGIAYPSISASKGDLVSYETSSACVIVDLNLKGPQAGGDARGDELINIESVTGSTFDDTITVKGGFAYGNGGRDKLVGGNSSDVLYGGDAADKLFGGAGNDHLVGDDADTTSLPRYSADELYGGDGNDLLTGGVGGDLLNGGIGDDLYFMVDAGDILVDSGGIDTVITNESYFRLGTEIENLIFSDSGDPTSHTGHGNGNDNILVGGSGDDTLFAGAGNDMLDGSYGNDVYDDLQGHDTIFFGDGNDLARGFGATGGDEQDIINLANRGYTDLNDFLNQGGSITQVGEDTQIRLYEDGPTLTLRGVSIHDIDDADFYFG